MKTTTFYRSLCRLPQIRKSCLLAWPLGFSHVLLQSAKTKLHELKIAKLGVMAGTHRCFTIGKISELFCSGYNSWSESETKTNNDWLVLKRQGLRPRYTRQFSLQLAYNTVLNTASEMPDACNSLQRISIFVYDKTLYVSGFRTIKIKLTRLKCVRCHWLLFCVSCLVD